MKKTQPVMSVLQEAVALHQAGRLAEAERLYDRVLKADARNADALNLKGVIADSQGRRAEAVALFDRALAVRVFPEAAFNRANALAGLERAAEAIAGYRQALALRPAYADAYVNLGLLLRKADRRAEALEAFAAMAAACPTDARAHYGLALERDHAGDKEGAVAAARRAVELRPGWPQAWNDLGTYLATADDPDGALAAYDTAARLDPEYLSPRVNRGLIHLAHGRYGQGFDEYSLRLADPENPFRPPMVPSWPWPAWQGEALTGKHILLWHDQGLGDAILLASMVPEVLAAAARCTILCDARLVPLFARSFPRAEVLAQDAVGRPFRADLDSRGIDVHCTLLDLGRWLRRGLADFPDRPAYLACDAVRTADLRSRYRAGPRHQAVGFSWHSANPVVGSDKSLQLEEFVPLLRIANLRGFSLQYGDAARDLATLQARTGYSLIAPPEIDPLNDLDGLAALIGTLDLVITVSNTTAHLAAALGTETWVLVPTGRPRLWYWPALGDRTPWYPRARLFRRGQEGVEAARAILDIRFSHERNS